MLNYKEKNFRLFFGNWQVLTKQREGHLRDGTEFLETQKLSRERWECGGRGGGTSCIGAN